MKYNIKNKITIDLDITLDSSETIIFNEGGMHKITLPLKELINLDQPYDKIVQLDEAELNISFQLERDQMERHDWITREAAKTKSFTNEDMMEFEKKGLIRF